MSFINNAGRFIQNPDICATDMNGDTVMLDIERGEYFGLGGVGSRIWELLAQPATLATLVTTLCNEFEVEAAVCDNDTRTFLNYLYEHGLIKEA